MSLGVSESVVDPDSGRRGSFGVVCPFSHRNEDDPIVFPDESGCHISTIILEQQVSVLQHAGNLF